MHCNGGPTLKQGEFFFSKLPFQPLSQCASRHPKHLKFNPLLFANLHLDLQILHIIKVHILAGSVILIPLIWLWYHVDVDVDLDLDLDDNDDDDPQPSYLVVVSC